MFFDPRKFDFSRVGRLKFNIKMGKPERDRIDDPLLSAHDFYRSRYLRAEDAQEPSEISGGRHRSPRQPPRSRGR